MAIERVRFDAQAEAIVKEIKARKRAVFLESVQRTIEIMQTPVAKGGNMPVDTGFLRSSLRLVRGDSVSLPPLVDAPAGLAAGGMSYDPGPIALVLVDAQLNDKLTAVFTAKYARRQNYGFRGRDSLGRAYNQRGYNFVGLATQRWHQTVEQVLNDLKARTST